MIFAHLIWVNARRQRHPVDVAETEMRAGIRTRKLGNKHVAFQFDILFTGSGRQDPMRAHGNSVLPIRQSGGISSGFGCL